MSSEPGTRAKGTFWECRCGAVLLAPRDPGRCPRAALPEDGGRHGLTPLSGPRPFDYLVVPGACRPCAGPMVATGDEVVDALPRARCAACGWSWFFRPGDVADFDRFARRRG